MCHTETQRETVKYGECPHRCCVGPRPHPSAAPSDGPWVLRPLPVPRPLPPGAPFWPLVACLGVTPAQCFCTFCFPNRKCINIGPEQRPVCPLAPPAAPGPWPPSLGLLPFLRLLRLLRLPWRSFALAVPFGGTSAVPKAALCEHERPI